MVCCEEERVQDFVQRINISLVSCLTRSALRDAIACQSDRLTSRADIPSAYFFIEGTFYDDTRDANAIRYSETVTEWATEADRYGRPRHLEGLPMLAPFDIGAPMHEVTFEQLRVRLGSHYAFTHQGDCTHTIVVSEMRCVLLMRYHFRLISDHAILLIVLPKTFSCILSVDRIVRR